MITDTDILFYLEGTGGIDRFCATLDEGFEVPKCFAARVIKIIKAFYDVDMIAVETGERKNGTFCLMDYNDIIVEIKNKDTV